VGSAGNEQLEDMEFDKMDTSADPDRGGGSGLEAAKRQDGKPENGKRKKYGGDEKYEDRDRRGKKMRFVDPPGLAIHERRR
jgi:hypothetical protein